MYATLYEKRNNIIIFIMFITMLTLKLQHWISRHNHYTAWNTPEQSVSIQHVYTTDISTYIKDYYRTSREGLVERHVIWFINEFYDEVLDGTSDDCKNEKTEVQSLGKKKNNWLVGWMVVWLTDYLNTDGICINVSSPIHLP